MQKLTDTFRFECLANDAKRTNLFGAFIKKSVVAEEDKLSIELTEEEKTAFIIDLRNWLCRVMYAICYPPIDEKSAKPMALTHPVAYWLFDHADQVEASVQLIVHLYPDARDLICCLKLLDTVGRFRKYILPEMIKTNEETVKDLSQLYPDIYIIKNL